MVSKVNNVMPDSLTEMCSYIEKVMIFIETYESSRPGSHAFTKLEEAILWLQVMVNNVDIKKKEEVKIPLEGELIAEDQC